MKFEKVEKTEVEKVEKTRPIAVKSGDVFRPYESGINPPPSPKLFDLQGITPPPAPVFPKREPRQPSSPPPPSLVGPKVIPATRDIPDHLRVLLPGPSPDHLLAPPDHLLARPPNCPPPDHLRVPLARPPNCPPPDHLLAPDSSSPHGVLPPWRDPSKKRKRFH